MTEYSRSDRGLKLAKKPRLYLHIGLPKTATTTIQTFLSDNRAQLREQGILYPQAGISGVAHHQFGAAFEGLARDWVEDCSLPELLASLRAEVTKSRCSRVILSSEIFTFVRDPDRLRQTLATEYDMTVLVSLRRQDKWLESCLRQDIQVGDYSGTVERFVALKKHHCDYLALVDFWESVLGRDKVVLRLMPRSGERSEVQRNFLEDCRISWSASFSLNADSNPRLSRECLEFLQSAPDERRVAGVYLRVRELLGDYSAEHPDLPQHRSMLSPAMARELLSEFEAGNAEIAKRYFPESNGRLFEPFGPDEESGWEEYPGLDLRAAGRIAFYLIDRLSRRHAPRAG